MLLFLKTWIWNGSFRSASKPNNRAEPLANTTSWLQILSGGSSVHVNCRAFVCSPTLTGYYIIYWVFGCSHTDDLIVNWSLTLLKWLKLQQAPSGPADTDSYPLIWTCYIHFFTSVYKHIHENISLYSVFLYFGLRPLPISGTILQISAKKLPHSA